MCRWCQTEINQSDGVLLSNHDIVWFDISVDHILCVAMINGLEKLLHISSGAYFCKCLIFLLYNFLVHGHPFDVLHDEIDVFLIVVSFIVPYNIGVVKGVERGNLGHDIW